VKNVFRLIAAVVGFGLLTPLNVAARDNRGPGTLFIRSAVEHGDGTVTLPLHRGTSRGQTVWFVVLDASDGKVATALGINTSPKLGNARGTRAVQIVQVVDGVIDFPATVAFSPKRRVVLGPLGFPPDVAEPGAVGQVPTATGQAGYSPLIQLPDGTIVNAPHLANDTGQADKVVHLDIAGSTVTHLETEGFQGGKKVRYVSTDSSNPVAAALENVTWAPLLGEAPFAGGDGTDSSRASSAAFVNGQTGAGNPQRQGLNSALLDGLDPLNVLAWNPSQGRYSPLWDVHLTAWTLDAVRAGANQRQKDFGDVEDLAEHGQVTAPDGSPFGPSGFIVNCPIVSSD
jgi:hypothetical protein